MEKISIPMKKKWTKTCLATDETYDLKHVIISSISLIRSKNMTKGTVGEAVQVIHTWLVKVQNVKTPRKNNLAISIKITNKFAL